MVARREDAFAREAELAGDFRQRRALAVGRVAEARIHVVAHHRQVWHGLAVVLQVRLDVVRVRVRARDEAEGRIGVRIHGGAEMAVDPLEEARQVLVHRLEQLPVRSLAVTVPRLQREEARPLSEVNLPLHRHQPVRLNAQARAAQPLHQAAQVTPGVDDPLRPAPLEITDEFLQAHRHRWLLVIRVQRPVEVGRDELDGQGHRVGKVSSVQCLVSRKQFLEMP